MFHRTRNLLSKAVVLDIDGVLLRGGKPFPRAQDAMQLLKTARIPFVFVTNGGGITEKEKSLELTKKLGIDVTPEQVILSHSPFKHLAAAHIDQRVLVLGHERCVDVARSYGFHKATTSKRIHEEFPTIYPLRKPSSSPSCNFSGQPVEAIMIFHDPTDWGLDMQVVCDVILDRLQYKKDENTRTEQEQGQGQDPLQKLHTVPFFVSNQDVVYKSDHFYPRFTQGAFVEAFKSLFSNYNGGMDLKITYCGKPFKVQYEMAAKALAHEASLLGFRHIDTSKVSYYGIGDNPPSDIRGANNAGKNWTSILVRTGVFDGADGENDPVDPADIIVDDVYEAVKFIVRDD
jgi:HAD superfamily hydrolase (TIGR01456 family)